MFMRQSRRKLPVKCIVTFLLANLQFILRTCSWQLLIRRLNRFCCNATLDLDEIPDRGLNQMSSFQKFSVTLIAVKFSGHEILHTYNRLELSGFALQTRTQFSIGKKQNAPQQPYITLGSNQQTNGTCYKCRRKIYCANNNYENQI